MKTPLLLFHCRFHVLCRVFLFVLAAAEFVSRRFKKQKLEEEEACNTRIMYLQPVMQSEGDT